MKSQYSAKLIQYFLRKNNSHGFTIIELLIIIMIIGILSAIALPSLVGCGSRARLAEGKTYVGSMNRAQQAYFLESNGKFSNSLSKLGLGIQEQTKNYNYSTKATTNAAFNYGIATRDYIDNGWFNRKPVKSFVGGVFVISTAKKSEITTLAILCQNEKPGNIIPPAPIYKNGIVNCSPGTILIK